MFSKEDFARHLAARFDAQVAVLYGSSARGLARSDGDIDVVCFTDAAERYPTAYLWDGFLVDAWIHPLSDTENAAAFLKLHDGQVLLDRNRIGEDLLSSVARELEQPPPRLDPRAEEHLREWAWKMLDRASRTGPEADHRRHWLLSELPEVWCKLTQRHFLGPATTFQRMRTDAERSYEVLEHALTPSASLLDIERAVLAIVGRRDRQL